MDKKVLEQCAEHFNKQEGRPYPCSNQIVICGIITRDRNKAMSVMETKGAAIKKLGNNDIVWELNNERWYWKRWSETMRGCRFHKVIIDNNVDDELFLWTKICCATYCCSMEIV